MPPRFDLQGHRGARGLKPENTLPSFEQALDIGVTTIETDVHLTRDGVPILTHDPFVSPRLFRRLPGASVPEPDDRLAVCTLSLEQIRSYAADRNPDPDRFPGQDWSLTFVAAAFMRKQGLDPYTPPTVTDFLSFAQAYSGDLGRSAGKTDRQRERAKLLRFDLELKRIPFHPEVINDGFDGEAPGLLERQVVTAIQAAGVLDRTIIRSFDHRSVRAIKQLEPRLTTAILITGTAPVDVPALVRQAGAQIYCPEYHFLDEHQVRQAHASGITVVPWTVNDADAAGRLLDWGVDGITTDFPDQLARFLEQRAIEF